MGVIDDKKKVFGQIAAFRTLSEGFPEVTLTDSFPSLNNNASSLDFLIDLLKSLIGFEEMRDTVVDILINLPLLHLNLPQKSHFFGPLD